LYYVAFTSIGNGYRPVQTIYKCNKKNNIYVTTAISMPVATIIL